MNGKILLSAIACIGLLFGSIYSTTDTFIKKINPWSVTPALTISTTLKGQLPSQNILEIQTIEKEILRITAYLQEIQKKLGENFNGFGSTSPLTPRELRNLRVSYTTMISNYLDIVRWFGSTDHYYMPLSHQEYEELLNLVNHFAEKAGVSKLQRIPSSELQSVGG